MFHELLLILSAAHWGWAQVPSHQCLGSKSSGTEGREGLRSLELSNLLDSIFHFTINKSLVLRNLSKKEATWDSTLSIMNFSHKVELLTKMSQVNHSFIGLNWLLKCHNLTIVSFDHQEVLSLLTVSAWLNRSFFFFFLQKWAWFSLELV